MIVGLDSSEPGGLPLLIIRVIFLILHLFYIYVIGTLMNHV